MKLKVVRKHLLSIGAFAGAALIALVGVPAMAHHSGAAFDDSRTIEISGTVKEFQYTNPHSWIQVNVENEQGETVEWSVEWRSPPQLVRAGFGPNTFQPGDKVRIKTHPMKNGEPAGTLVGLRFEDGQTIGDWEKASDNVDSDY